MRFFSVRFAAITQLHEAIRCTGKVVEKFTADGEQRVRVSVQTANEAGVVKLAGEAIVALP